LPRKYIGSTRIEEVAVFMSDLPVKARKFFESYAKEQNRSVQSIHVEVLTDFVNSCIDLNKDDRRKAKSLGSLETRHLYHIRRPPIHLTSFDMPTKEWFETIRPESIVKTIVEQPGCDSERIWTLVRAIDKAGNIAATLVNDPIALSLRSGHEIRFHVTDVIDILKDLDQSIEPEREKSVAKANAESS
jgi:hypothetical protein